MRELTINEIDQVGGGATVAFNMATSCALGVATSDSVGMGVVNCLAGAAVGVAFTIAASSGPLGMLGWSAVGVGVGYAVHKANQWHKEQAARWENRSY